MADFWYKGNWNSSFHILYYFDFLVFTLSKLHTSNSDRNILGYVGFIGLEAILLEGENNQ